MLRANGIRSVISRKFRVSNSKKNNYSQSKIDRHLSYIEQKTEEYLQQLDQADAKELTEGQIQLIQEKINGEFALTMTVYNLRRTINILGMTDMLEKLGKWIPDYQKVSLPSKSTLLKSIKALWKDFDLDRRVLKLIIVLNRVHGLVNTNR